MNRVCFYDQLGLSAKTIGRAEICPLEINDEKIGSVNNF